MTGSGTPADPYVIWDVTDLQNMNLDPTACYELGQDIDASATVGWNGGLGFDPVDVAALIQDYYPTGDDSQAGAWTIFPADGIYWNKVDEMVPDEDATYIQTNAAGAWILFAFAGVTPPANSNQFRVTIDARARRMGGGAHTYRGYIRMAGQTYQSFDYEATGVGYTNRTSFFNNNPRTGLPWTVADLATIEAFGVYVIAAPVNLRFTQIRLRLEYGTFTFDGQGHTVTDLTINRPLEDYVGLFGALNNAPISNVTLTAVSITGNEYVGALAGEALSHAIADCISSGTVYGLDHYVGGLVGNSNWPSTITRCSSSCSVSSENSEIGGLIGEAYYATLSNCHATGVVTGIFNVWWPSSVGGLVGQGYYDYIIDCYATGLCSSGVPGGGGDRVAGLVGQSYYNEFTNCYCTGHVSGDGYSGGFVGQGYYCTFTGCHATGNVVDDGPTGGFIGQSQFNNFTDCYAVGYVDGPTSIQNGGFGGQMGTNTLTRCYATGNVTTQAAQGGGFGGDMQICICTDCYATGDVTIVGADDAGGFNGGDHAASVYLRCYATGNVIADDDVGGFVPRAFGTYTQCYAIGNVTGGLGAFDRGFGGFAAWLSQATMTDCYCLGNVSGNERVGGFVGELNHASASITRCYCKGHVTGNTDVGGFVGLLTLGTITNCFWDIETSGQSTSAGGYGETTTRMQDIDTFLAAGWDMEQHKSVDMANGYPFLSWQIPGASPVWYIFVPPGAPPPFPKIVTLPATEIR